MKLFKYSLVMSGGGKISIKVKNITQLTKEELLFLHLLKNNHHQDRYVVSEIITEKGIHEALDCDLGLISRILKKNEEKGWIYQSLLKIENKKRKQNAFFLTKEGLEIALELNNLKLSAKGILLGQEKIDEDFK